MTLDDIISLHRAGKLAEAESGYLHWINDHPDEEAAFPAIWNNLGAIYFAQQKWREAAVAYQHAIALRADYIDAYYNLGLAQNKMGNIDHALVTWQALLELSPQHSGARFQVGRLLMMQRKFEEAIKQFADIAESHTSYIEAQGNMATCCLQLGWLNTARKHYENVLKKTEEDVQTLYNLGVIHGQQGALEEAVNYYLRAVAADPNFFAAQNNLGAAYLALKNREAAMRHFQEALRIQPANEVVRHTIAILTQKQDITASPQSYIAAIFDSYADHYDAHLAHSLQYQVPAQMYDMLHHATQLPVHQWKVLDLGCGTGLCAQYVRDAASTLIGVDLSERMLDVARNKKIYDTLVKAEAVEFLTQHKSAYDLIIAADTLVYMGDLAPMFSAAQESLLPAGYFIFNTEATDADAWHLTATGRFAHSKAYLDQLIAEHKFQIVAFRTVTLRLQDDWPVQGYLYLLQKN